MSLDDDLAHPQQALREAIGAVLAPLARLAVARGLPFALLEEQLKRAAVEAAAAQHPELAPHRRVSRIATATGISRREVTRLVQMQTPARQRTRSIAEEVFAHWLGSRDYLDAKGRPLALPRTGARPSFESLAQDVTRHVHPRSVLDELLRLGLAALDEASDRVTLSRDGFVPAPDRQRMLQLLGDNLGDHASAAVDNVLGDGRAHFEQAVFADGLTEASLQALRPLITAQWKLLLEAFVPPLEAMVEADAKTPNPRRVRIGLYAFDTPMPTQGAGRPGPAAPSAQTATAPSKPAVPRRRPRKT